MHKYSFLGILLLTASCETATKESENASLQNEESVPITPHAIDNIFSRITGATLVARQIEASGSEIDFTRFGMNRYPYIEDKNSQAIVSGMMLVDISFLVAYGETDKAEAYFDKLNSLSGNFTNTREETIEQTTQSFSASLENSDSLNRLINSIYDRVTLPLSLGDYNEYAVIFLSAVVLENMRVNSLAIDQYPQDMLEVDKRSIIVLPLLKTFMDQESNLAETIAILNEGPDTPFHQNLLVRLQNVNEKFDQLTIHENLRNNRIDLVLPDSTLAQVRNEIYDTRQWMYDMIIYKN